jgi:ribosomal protein S18 acetylase RimI-like enzyme
MSTITIKQISSRETFPVRHPVLRLGKPIETCIFAGDDDVTTVHFGVYENDVLAGVLSVFEVLHPDFTEERQFQLRGMAILPSYQKTGLGEQLLTAAENYIRQQDGKLIWFNAREIAVGFYKKAGYKIKNGPFPVQDIGPHYVMYKKL